MERISKYEGLQIVKYILIFVMKCILIQILDYLNII